MKKALVIRHVPFEDVGNIAEVLKQNGFEIDYAEAGLDQLGCIDPLEPELLIVLGGPIGAYEEHHYPFLMDELRMLESRLAADQATLGICLGAQLMARALGARVYAGPEKEIGWSTLRLTQCGRDSPLQDLTEETAVLHWHGDTFDLPDGARHLAATSVYDHQAFAWGQRGLALQFHLEVTRAGIERWLIGHACEIGVTPEVSVTELRQATQRYADPLQMQAGKVWQSWLDNVLVPNMMEV